MGNDELAEKRHQIDRIDEEVVHLLNKRARIAQEIGAAKNVTARATYAPDREHEVLELVKAAGAEGPLSGSQLSSIYRQIVSACRALERTLRVAYLGPAARFTHQAAIARLGDATAFAAVASIP